jgi:hypothetical protein
MEIAQQIHPHNDFESSASCKWLRKLQGSLVHKNGIGFVGLDRCMLLKWEMELHVELVRAPCLGSQKA